MAGPSAECPSYKLYYHFGEFAGRGEPVRMLLHLTGAVWEDSCREKQVCGPAEVKQHLVECGEVKGQPLLFPPTLVDHTMSPPIAITQLPCIMQYLGEKHGLAGNSLQDRTRALQIAMTWNDLLAEAMTAFHPVKLNESYQSQKAEAQPFIEKFLASRLSTFLQFFEDNLKINDGGRGFMIGSSLSFADVAILNMLRGYRGSASQHFQDNQEIPLLKALETRLEEEPGIKSFLGSDRTVNKFLDSFC
eukprot:GFUD01081434.1.p1 GENE.GFUD01081434.1~~GFUD01081434.1.p1  ORF type:complete len:247 (-),score=48.85 GFUD01081434.1:131-871(-)